MPAKHYVIVKISIRHNYMTNDIVIVESNRQKNIMISCKRRLVWQKIIF